MISKEGIPSDHHHSPDLEAVLVEQILQACIPQASLTELRLLMPEMQPSLSTKSLRKYLFYLIEYDFITYHGNNHVFVLTSPGLGLLYLIKKEKKISKKNINDIMIALE